MRIAIAAFGQETCSFSPLRTTMEDFRSFGIYEGEELLEKMRETGPLGGFFAAAKAEGVEYTPLPLFRAWAGAGGPIEWEVIEHFADKLRAGLRRVMPIDGMFFAIHGAAASTKVDDAEGYLLQVVRDVIGPDVPLVAPMDHHGNITQLKMKCLTALVGFSTQPHDQEATGERAARLLFRILRGEIRPVMAWRKIPMITHQEQFLTRAGPMKEWFEMAREIERQPGVVSVSTFPMQPWLDVEEGGWASVVVTDGDRPLAERLAAKLANKAWSLRHAFWKMDSIPVEQAVRRAIEAPRGLVVLSDTGDTIWGGAPGDSTHILSELLRQRVDQAALVPVVDAPAVGAAIAAGIGSEITISVGGTLDTTFARPITVTGRVAGIGGGRLYTRAVGAESFDMGRAVLLEIGAIKLMISERLGISGNHPIVYQQFGVDPAMAKMVVVKTSSNWQYYNQWLSEVIRVDSPGPTMSHIERFEWKRTPQPFWPLSPDMEWEAPV